VVAQVNVMINGYSYTLGCEDGQEPHLLAMAADVESRMDTIKALGTSTSEQRLLVLAALLLADELHDLRVENDKLRAKAGKSGRAKADGPASVEAVHKISLLAERAEQIANGLDPA
jgi:cell division protein ZapA